MGPDLGVKSREFGHLWCVRYAGVFEFETRLMNGTVMAVRDGGLINEHLNYG